VIAPRSASAHVVAVPTYAVSLMEELIARPDIFAAWRRSGRIGNADGVRDSSEIRTLFNVACFKITDIRMSLYNP
jgi:hypothetical protein